MGVCVPQSVCGRRFRVARRVAMQAQAHEHEMTAYSSGTREHDILCTHAHAHVHRSTGPQVHRSTVRLTVDARGLNIVIDVHVHVPWLVVGWLALPTFAARLPHAIPLHIP